MSQELYEVVAYAMRYWFILLMALMLFAVVLISVREYRERKVVLIEAGKYIGYIEIVAGNEDLVGMNIAFTDKNTVGKSSGSDMVIDDPSILKSHALLYLKNDSMNVSPMGENALVRVNGRRISRAKRVCDGDTIDFGDIISVLHMRNDYDN